ncbi:metallophosphoesterase family protein [Arsenicicoccus dermatophilus]|uniref:metallophosphoesterase family protein n=1 Tax=Arsenicicoccus dermatophilus TaxID=1076331 RepID=UPI0039174BC6
MTVTRRQFTTAMIFAGAAGATAPGLSALATPRPQDRTGQLALLSDPMLLAPRRTSVSVVWFTEAAGTLDLVLLGEGVRRLRAADARPLAAGHHRLPDIAVFPARTTVLSQTAEDQDSDLPADRRPARPTRRVVRRHEAVVGPLRPGRRVPYRVVSIRGSEVALSATYTLTPAPAPGAPVRLMLTSDHQDKVNTPRNLETAARTMGALDAVILAGDLVNVPDRASEWFDSRSGSAFFPGLQGRAHRADTSGRVSTGAAIIQNVPLWPAIGNHEVMGRTDGAPGLNAAFTAAVPRAVADREARTVPARGSRERARWIEQNSFSSRTYEEIFASLPASRTGGVRYYATTIGDVRLITLYVTRIWRGTEASADPARRATSSRYHDATATMGKPLERGYGEFVFESIAVGSEQYRWLVRELGSPERAACRYTIVQLHEGPHGLGDNMMPHFGDPEQIEERDATGAVVGIRYEYPERGNMLLNDLAPLLERAGVQLVLNGHSHLWNRFEARNGITHYLEASNTGNTYGAYHATSGARRAMPTAPWDLRSYWPQDDPGRLQPQRPTSGGVAADDLFVASNDHVVFQCFDSGTGTVTSWIHEVARPDEEPRVLDTFTLRPSRG